MTWPEIVGHDQVLDRFRRNLQMGRLASTFLFVGPAGVGKRTAALKLAQALLCETTSPSELDACYTCFGCQHVVAGTHPDLIFIEKPADKSFIPIELLIGDREHRMRQGLCHEIAMTPFRGGRKIAILDDADRLNMEGANSLLKTLEEPPPGAVIILIGTSEQRQLPTIRSRCQIVRFAPLSNEQVASLLRNEPGCDGVFCDGVFCDGVSLDTLAARAEGSLVRAMELADSDLEEARRALLEQLSQDDFDDVALTKEVSAFVDAAGKDAPARRARLRQVIRAAAEFYRFLMRDLVGAERSRDDLADPFVAAVCERWIRGPQSASACLDRCLESLDQIDANANLATLIACWIDDLAQLTLRATRR